MQNITKKQFLILLIFAILINGKNILPVSRQATIIESTSPTEVMVRATGIGICEKQGLFDKVTARELNQKAEYDAEKAAIWYLLRGSTDPILQTEVEKHNFEKIQAVFFERENLRQFIVWEAKYFQDRIKLTENILKIVKDYKINTQLLNQYLANQKVIKDRSELEETLGLPNIMVIPAREGEKSPFELLTQNSNYKTGAEVIQSYLTARKYEVILPEQQQQMQEQVAAQFALSGTNEDYSYLLALSIGSDIYITYNISIASRMVGSTEVKKAIVGCQAYETTTSRLLGTETGYSEERNAPEKVLIEEALHSAINSVLSRINAYWKKDISKGLQYKIMVKVSQNYSKNEAEEIIFSMGDIFQKIAQNVKEEGFGDYTYDVRLWIAPDKFNTTTDIYRAIKNNYNGVGVINRVSLTGKLILLKIENEF
ncbi:MAG: DUF6175 family protein [Candidatus Marinimicrobia bacterium]|nr:DUF6175 family protein [Candidatus Neomarinimicrobiota bacterium]